MIIHNIDDNYIIVVCQVLSLASTDRNNRVLLVTLSQSDLSGQIIGGREQVEDKEPKGRSRFRFSAIQCSNGGISAVTRCREHSAE